MSESESRLAALGLSLPAVGKPLFNYVPFRRAGDVAYLSGQVPRHADGSQSAAPATASRSRHRCVPRVRARPCRGRTRQPSVRSATVVD